MEARTKMFPYLIILTFAALMLQIMLRTDHLSTQQVHSQHVILRHFPGKIK